ncbi:hypothetical protein OAS86_06365, partial [Gammaproteobacteria bacterium]|nr:hypothetical protein [Gammaproteobacteria bacterium]
VFYIDLGFDKSDIANATKVFGLLMTLIGGIVGGLVIKRIGVLNGMLLGGLLAALTNVLFAWLATQGQYLPGLYAAIGFDNLAGGMASAAFVAFLSALTNREFTATQYATLFAVTAIFPKLVAAKSGEWVEGMGYAHFFLMTAAIGVPTLIFLWQLKRRQPPFFE